MTGGSLVAIAVLAFAPSCGGSKHDNGFGGPDGSYADGSSGSGGGVNEVGTFGGDMGTNPSCGLKCSPDLHDVTDCNGNVVTACPADQGCGGTTCVPACASADANKSTFGCEFYAVDPDVISVAQGACFAMFIANTWSSPVNITADWGGQTIDVATAAVVPNGSGTSLTYQKLGGTALQPGQVAILFLNNWNNGQPPSPPLNFACPAGVTPAFTAKDGAVHGTALGKAFHIKTDRPVVAYDIFPFGGGQSAATSGTLLIPTSAWDVNYMAVNAFAQSALAAPEATPTLDIVASQPNTTVTLSPVAAITGGTGVAAAAKGTPTKYVLANPGDYVQFAQAAELTGTPILADKPVGVWGGASCLNIGVSTCCCDSAHQELFPVKTLGHEYVLARYRDRFPGVAESTPWRFVGAVAGTTLTYEPVAPNGAPTTLGVGQLVQFNTIAPFVVRSQDAAHPFYVSAHMTGADTVNPNETDGRGDPEFVNVIPPAEYLASYVFFTDPTYPETNLVLTRVKGPSGFADVTMDCGPGGGVVTGWLPVGSTGQYQVARIDLSTGNFVGQNGCNNGRHQIKSNTPFGLTVWGWGSGATGNAPYTEYVSYAYPAGASVQPINTVVVPPTAQ